MKLALDGSGFGVSIGAANVRTLADVDYLCEAAWPRRPRSQLLFLVSPSRERWDSERAPTTGPLLFPDIKSPCLTPLRLRAFPALRGNNGMKVRTALNSKPMLCGGATWSA